MLNVRSVSTKATGRTNVRASENTLSGHRARNCSRNASNKSDRIKRMKRRKALKRSKSRHRLGGDSQCTVLLFCHTGKLRTHYSKLNLTRRKRPMTLMMMEIHLTRAARAVVPRRAARHRRRRRMAAAVQVTATMIAVHRRTRMKSHRPRRRRRSRRGSVCDCK